MVSDIGSSCSERGDSSFPSWFAVKHKMDPITGLPCPRHWVLWAFIFFHQRVKLDRSFYIFLELDRAVNVIFLVSLYRKAFLSD